MPEPTPLAKLQVFLCHSSGDKEEVRALYHRLLAEEWIYPWLDEEELIPGQDWRLEIKKAVKQSHVILVCLSPASITKEGFVQREIRMALEYADEMPEGTIYIIPLKLQPCQPPDNLSKWHWVDYYEERGHENLMRGLRFRAKELGIKTAISQPPPPTTVQPKTPETEQNPLVRELENPATTHQRRREIGDRLNEIGDPRPGTGIIKMNINGRKLEIPDLAWCDIPAPPGDKVWLGATNEPDNLRREVELNYSFKMAKYPITYRQFQTFVDADEYNDPRWWRSFPEQYYPQLLKVQHYKMGNYPRDSVSWYQSVAFTRWLTANYREVGQLDPALEIRLPIEWEWEYAARGLDERPYPWGEWQENHANTSKIAIDRTTAVGIYSQGGSPFGVLDMSGQVWEWCLDKYSDKHDDRVMRGGSFDYDPLFATSFYRLYLDPLYATRSCGLRPVLASPIRPWSLNP